MAPFRRYHAWLLFAFSCIDGFGCAAVPYRHGQFWSKSDEKSATATVITYGRPHEGLDTIAWVVGLPSRILPLHAGVNNHSLSVETTDKLTKYLEDNELTDVYVRVNQYDPAGEWTRLRENSQISPGWRYSVGALSLVSYSVFPGRIFGGDQYNPFTNSLYVNSDVSAVVLSEAAYAKDIHSRRFPGAYATINELPVLSLWRRLNAVNDVLGYARNEKDWAVERETYRVVYPQIGIHAAGGGHTIAALATAMPLFTIPIVALGGAVVGHAVGQVNIAHRSVEWNKGEPILGDLQVTEDSVHTN